MRPLTIPKAAKESGLPYSTLLRLVNGKHVRSIELPGRRSKLVDLDDVLQYLEAVKSGGTVSGTEVEKEASQTAPNKGSRKTSRVAVPGDKYSWMDDFTAKGKPC